MSFVLLVIGDRISFWRFLEALIFLVLIIVNKKLALAFDGGYLALQLRDQIDVDALAKILTRILNSRDIFGDLLTDLFDLFAPLDDPPTGLSRCRRVTNRST